MATLRIDGSELVVDLSTMEKVGALMGGVRVPLSSVRGVRTTDRPYSELRGLRVGTGLPFVVVLGRMMFLDGTDFVAIYGFKRRAVVVDLAETEKFARLLLTDQAPGIVEQLKAATGLGDA